MKHVLLVLLCVGCAPVHQFIRLESEPSGARVLMGKEYLGQTPCEAEITDYVNGDRVPRDRSGALIGLNGFVIEFTAVPPVGPTNLFAQRLTFRASTLFYPGERIPGALFFDLTKPAAH